MKRLKFSTLCLFSKADEKGLLLQFSKPTTVICAPNGMGKSVVIKSLYECLGAIPPKINKKWKSSNSTSALFFSIDDEPYVVIKTPSIRALFSGDRLIETKRTVSSFGEVLAKHLNFGLKLPDRNGEIVTPPPAYAFAPYYIDQDKGWSEAWSSFDGLYLPRSKPEIPEYHSGYKPNEYYKRFSERRAQILRRDRILQEIDYLVVAGERIDSTFDDALDIQFSLEEFRDVTSELSSKCSELWSLQAEYRNKKAELAEEQSFWVEHHEMLSGALKETDKLAATSSHFADEVACPACGAEYANGIIERFGLLEDRDSIVDSILFAKTQMENANIKLERVSSDLRAVSEALMQLEATLAIKRGALTLEDVIQARGRAEASKAFATRTKELRQEAATADQRADKLREEMRAITHSARADDVQNAMRRYQDFFSMKLDVTSDESTRRGLHFRSSGRGSAHPRSILAYRYALLRTIREFGSSTYCPIVIDAPNQQGQDGEHLEVILKFIVDEKPSDSQLIMACEEFLLDRENVEVIDVSNENRGVLRREHYTQCVELCSPLMEQMLGA